MTKQLDLLDHMERAIPVVDKRVEPEDKPRLRGNSAAILSLLKSGPATNIQLMKVGGVRYGARIHDIKKAGYKIQSRRLDEGIWVYELEAKQ